jgi:hypothetical protein
MQSSTVPPFNNVRISHAIVSEHHQNKIVPTASQDRLGMIQIHERADLQARIKAHWFA